MNKTRKFPKRQKGKSKRWPKGQSSNSNPETRKFREAARSLFFHKAPSQKSTLTVGALKALDSINNQYPKFKEKKDGTCDDTATLDSWTSGKTFQTFASDWSECSNMSFSRLLNKFEPTSSHHKEMLAVLAAVASTIKNEGGNETSTEYYGALMTALKVADSEECVAATLSLLAMCIKSVPNEVLRVKFSSSCKIFLEILAKYCEVENATILRSAIGCLCMCMRVQDPGTWAHASTMEIFHSVLVFVNYTKPRVRKTAHHAVCAILKASTKFSENEIHPAAIDAAKYCIQQLEKEETSGGNTAKLHILGLLKEIIGVFPKNYIKSTCETVLKLMTVGNPLTITCCLEVLYGLFTLKPSSHNLTASLNAQILNALYDYQPSTNDVQATLAWITVLQEAHKDLAMRDPQLCLENLTKFFSHSSQLWLNDKTELVKGSVIALKTVAMDCLPECTSCLNYHVIVGNIVAIVENGLKYQYHTAWPFIFDLLGTLFETVGVNGGTLMINAVKSLAGLRDSHNFSHVAQLDHTIGKAIRFLGTEIVVKAIPISITGLDPDQDSKMSWMLPLLKENIHHASLKFFVDYLLPLAVICENKYNEYNAKNEKVAAHVYELLQLQVWCILPSVCQVAPDTRENFKSIAKILGNLISERKQLRIPAMASLRKLIGRCLERKEVDDKEELSRFAKNYLPIFFTLYTTKPQGSDEEGERLAAFDTTKIYLQIARREICAELFDRAIKIVDTPETDIFTKESVMDLLRLLIPYQDNDRLSLIYKKCLATIKTSKLQKDEKKAYRLLEAIVTAESTDCKNFVSNRSQNFLTFILKSLKQKNIQYRGARLRCLLHLLSYIPQDDYDALKEIVTEAVICCKDINQKTRYSATKLLERILGVYRKWSAKNDDEIIRDYINVVLGGLVGPPTLISATVLALTKLTTLLHVELPQDVTQLVLESVCLLMALPTREIVDSALGYIINFLKVMPKPILYTHLQAIVNAVVSMVDDCKNHFRLKTRDILDKLLKKFGYETMKSLLPQDEYILHKRLKNLKRIYIKKRQPNAKLDDKDALGNFIAKTNPKSIDAILDSIDDETKNKFETPLKETGKSYIQEGENNIIDFLNLTVPNQVTDTKPDIKPEKKEPDIKMSADGRIIITDDTKEEDEGDSDLQDIESMISEITIGKKRKMSGESVEESSIYKAGGTGIHRDTKIARIESERGTRLAKRKTQKDKITDLRSGREYRAKRARGDVKRAGKPDPYAYIPISRKSMKNKGPKNVTRFKDIVRAALSEGTKKSVKQKSTKKQRTVIL